MVRLWRIGKREGLQHALRFWTAFAIVAVPLCALMLAFSSLPLSARMVLNAIIAAPAVPLAYVLRGYLRLRCVRKMLRAEGCSCGNVTMCGACCQRWIQEGRAKHNGEPTHYPAITEARERARYASGATAAVAEARDRRERMR